MKMETLRLVLLSPQEVTAGAVAAYYRANRAFLEAWEPRRAEEFFTEARQHELMQLQRLDWERGGGYRFYLSLKEDVQTVIGVIALSNIVRGAFQSCHLGYGISGEHARRGLMTEAVQAAVKFAFDELRLHRIEANVMPENIPSIALLEKCGFGCEGMSPRYLHINGAWRDHLHYVRLNPAME